MTPTTRVTRTTPMTRTLALLAVVGALLALASVTPADARPEPESPPSVARADSTPLVVGRGGGTLQIPGFEGDKVRFELNAWASEEGGPTSVRGRFHVTHTRSDGKPFAEFKGKMDCLLVGGDTAVATGVITWSDSPALDEHEIDPVGTRVGFTVDDGRRQDRIGWSWYVGGFESAPPCMSTAPFFEIENGGFVVRD